MDCGDLLGDGVILLRVGFNTGTPAILATNAPITISGGGLSGCIYNSSGDPISMPVELINFTGTPSVQGNILTWITANEVNNKGFQVERLNGNDWQNIGFIAANSKAGTYQFIDNAPLSTSYYRLRQIDNDGKETLSKVITIQTNGTKGKLAVYPNPVSNILTVHTEGSDFQILNLLGQQVMSGKAPFGGLGAGLDVSALPQGSYVLKVGAEQVKFVKQ